MIDVSERAAAGSPPYSPAGLARGEEKALAADVAVAMSVKGRSNTVIEYSSPARINAENSGYVISIALSDYPSLYAVFSPSDVIVFHQEPALPGSYEYSTRSVYKHRSWYEQCDWLLFEKIVEEVISAAPKNAGEENICRYLHDWICQKVRYDQDHVEETLDILNIPRHDKIWDERGRLSTAYSVIVEGVGLCAGIALAFAYLCYRCGIKCVPVGNNEHAWNIVHVNGAWYNLDACWDCGRYIKNGKVGNFWDKNVRLAYLKSDRYMEELDRALGMAGSHARYDYRFAPQCADGRYDNKTEW